MWLSKNENKDKIRWGYQSHLILNIWLALLIK
jgi:hypothetical protein